MFDTIIVLAGPAEQSALATLLKNYNPLLDVRGTVTLAELDAIEPDVLGRARLIGFVTPVLVPARILNRFGYGAYNFHPGPPEYPGWMPSHFAIHDGVGKFGATAHIMIEKVDAGPIVAVERFAVPPNAVLETLEQLAYMHAARLLWRLAGTLATERAPLPEIPVQWSGRRSTRRMFAELFGEENFRIDPAGVIPAAEFGARL
jgi:methionyl-tRNA formyltransferase